MKTDAKMQKNKISSWQVDFQTSSSKLSSNIFEANNWLSKVTDSMSITVQKCHFKKWNTKQCTHRHPVQVLPFFYHYAAFLPCLVLCKEKKHKYYTVKPYCWKILHVHVVSCVYK